MADLDDGFDVQPTVSQPIEAPVPFASQAATGSLALPSGEHRPVTPFPPHGEKEVEKEAAAADASLRGISAPPGEERSQTPHMLPLGGGKTPGPSGGTPAPGRTPTPEPPPARTPRLTSSSPLQEEAAAAQRTDALGQNVLLRQTRIRQRSALGEMSERIEVTEQEVLAAEAKEKQRSISVLIGQGVPHDIAERLVEGSASNWEGFVEVGREEYRQISNIKGLKVYKDPQSGKLVADYSLKTIAIGGTKKIKSVLRFNNDGTITWMARYSRKKGMGPPEEEKGFQESFAMDIQRELQSREKLVQAGNGRPVPNLLEIVPVHYVNKRGESKIRYMAQRCVGDAYGLIADRETLEYLPDEQQKPRRALIATRDCLVALAEMHRRTMVHKDIKTANIFILREDDENPGGLLGDLGFAAQIDEPYDYRCSLEYAAPEVFIGNADRNTSAMDMYGIGVVLFEITSPWWALNLQRHQVLAYQSTFIQEPTEEHTPQAQTQEPPEDPIVEYRECLAYDQKMLRAEKDELLNLIADLLSLKPEDRPTAEKTLEVLSRYLQEHHKTPTLP